MATFELNFAATFKLNFAATFELNFAVTFELNFKPLRLESLKVTAKFESCHEIQLQSHHGRLLCQLSVTFDS